MSKESDPQYHSVQNEPPIAEDLVAPQPPNVIKENNDLPIEDFQISGNEITNALFYCEVLEILKKVSKKHSKTKKERQNLANGLYDLYLADGSYNKLKKFRLQWGKVEARMIFDLYVEKADEPLDQSEEKFAASIKDYSGIFERVKVSLKLRMKLADKSLTEQQKKTLLEITGYSKGEADNLVPKLILSGVVGFSLGTVYWVSSGSAFTAGLSHPIFENVDQKEAGIILAASYLANYGASLLSAIQNVRLLKDEKIENSPNFWATSSFLILNKLLAKSKKGQWARDGVTTIIAVGLPVWKELGMIPTAMTSERGLSAVTLSNLTAGATNILQATGDEIFLRVKGKKSKDPEIE